MITTMQTIQIRFCYINRLNFSPTQPLSYTSYGLTVFFYSAFNAFNGLSFATLQF